MPCTDWIKFFAADRTSSIRLEDAQVCFEVGDRVGFSCAPSRRLTGTIEKLNPKRARVRCGDGAWIVPYAGLDHLCESTAENRVPRARRLGQVAAQTRELMDRHGLQGWALRFSGARKKLGECRAREKLILLSRTHAVNGPPERVTDTILHEIAHALAGPAAGHGPAWKAIAERLGARPRARAPESDRMRSRREAARATFRAGDTVSFTSRGELHTGTIVRLNPKRAKVQCGGIEWSVPYTRLSANRRPSAAPVSPA